jgi:chloramphenicol-sensitive protein RarD
LPRSASVGQSSRRAGVLYCLATYTWWGLSPSYFKLLSNVSALTILCHRIVWSASLLVVLIGISGRWAEVVAIFRSPRARLWLIATTILIAINWLVFIYAISTSRLMESSLGYFINPLLTVLLGVIFLHERLRAMQWLAVALAAAGLAYLSFARTGLPWISLVLSSVFCFYSLIRKQLQVGALAGLFVETLMLTPFALAYLGWAHTRDTAGVFNTPATWGLLALSGPVTTIPLLWFVAAAKRLPLSTIGFLQYLNPTLQFLTAVLLFREPFGQERLVAFAVIWVAVAIFVLDSIRAARRDAAIARELF